MVNIKPPINNITSKHDCHYSTDPLQAHLDSN